jgi:hypothetical protein
MTVAVGVRHFEVMHIFNLKFIQAWSSRQRCMILLLVSLDMLNIIDEMLDFL